MIIWQPNQDYWVSLRQPLILLNNGVRGGPIRLVFCPVADCGWIYWLPATRTTPHRHGGAVH